MKELTAPEAERSLVGCILLDPGSMLEVSGVVSADDFYYDNNKWIFEAARDIMIDGGVVDFVTVATKLKDDGRLERIGGPEELANIQNEVPIASHAKHYAQIVRNRATSRAIVKAGAEIHKLGKDIERPVVEVLADASALLGKINTTTRTRSMFDVVSEFQESPDVKSTAFKTGMEYFDKVVGGIIPGGYHVLAAYSHTGKTTLALQWAAHIMSNHKKKCVWYSLEMTDVNMMRTIDRVQKARGSTVEEVPQWRFEIVSDLYDWDAIALDAQRKGADFIVVDYLQMLKGRPGLKKQEALEQIAFSIRAFCNRTGIAALVLSQVSEEARKNPGSFDAAKGGGDTYAASDIFINIRANEDSEKQDRIEFARTGANPGFGQHFDRLLLIAKNKFGLTGGAHIRYSWKEGDGIYTGFPRLEHGRTKGGND